MAKVVTTHYVDDLDGTKLKDDQRDTIEFTYRGRGYTLDLSHKNGAQFDTDMSKYIEAAIRAEQRSTETESAEKVPAKQARRSGPAKPTGRQKSRVSRRKAVAERNRAAGQLTAQQRKSIREWANSHGHNLSSRGRLPAEIIDAFNEAHS